MRDYGHDLPFVESNLLLADTFLELITNARKAMGTGMGARPAIVAVAHLVNRAKQAVGRHPGQ
jgi:hypothetical protein